MKSISKQYRNKWGIIVLVLVVGALAFAMTGCQTKQTVSSNQPIVQVAENVTKASTEKPASSVIIRTVATLKDDYQEVAIDLKPNSYGPIIVQKGIPVKFTIRATEDAINGCNNIVVFNDFKKEIQLKPGDNIVEFTPLDAGAYQYDCWMGMIFSTIRVVDDLSVLDSTGN